MSSYAHWFPYGGWGALPVQGNNKSLIGFGQPDGRYGSAARRKAGLFFSCGGGPHEIFEGSLPPTKHVGIWSPNMLRCVLTQCTDMGTEPPLADLGGCCGRVV
jgi:hypothetical protein